MAEKEMGHEELNFASAVENYLNPDFGELEEGSIVKGKVVRINKDNVLVDVNFKSEGQIPIAEFKDPAGNLAVKEGDEATTGLRCIRRHWSISSLTPLTKTRGTGRGSMKKS